MSLPFVLVLIAAFGLGIQRVFAKMGFGAYVTGVLFLLVGVGLGPFGTGILTAKAVTSFQPVVSLMMGIIGLILGLPLHQAIRDSTFALPGVTTSLGIGGVVGGVSLGALRWLVGPKLGIGEMDQVWLAITLGSAATAVSTPLIYHTVRHIKSSGPVSDSLFAWALVSNILSVVVAGGALAAARAIETGARASLTKTEWLVTCAGIGIICGVLYTLFLDRGLEENKDRTFLATVAIVVFASGLAAAMGVSPMLVNLFAGLTTSLLYRKTDILYQMLLSLYEPVCTMLAILAGAMWIPLYPIGWFFAVGYLAVRLVTTYLLGAVAARTAEPRLHASRFGTGVWGQGALAIAVVVNFAQVNPALSSLVLTAVFPALLVGDLIGLYAVRTMLIDAGESAPVPEALEPVKDLNEGISS